MTRRGLTWLHLSDLHRGQAGDQRWINSRDKLLADIAAMASQLGKPDLILFTGDLTQKGIEPEFCQVDETIREIYGALGASPPVVPVPGNHDLQRPSDLADVPAGLRADPKSHRAC